MLPVLFVRIGTFPGYWGRAVDVRVSPSAATRLFKRRFLQIELNAKIDLRASDGLKR